MRVSPTSCQMKKTFGRRQRSSREGPSHSLGPLHCHNLPHHRSPPHPGGPYLSLKRLCSSIASSPFCPSGHLFSHYRSLFSPEVKVAPGFSFRSALAALRRSQPVCGHGPVRLKPLVASEYFAKKTPSMIKAFNISLDESSAYV